MEHPKVPVYIYPYTHKPIHVLKICNHEEYIEKTEMKAYYTICCTVRVKGTCYKEGCMIRLLASVMDETEPVTYISSALASKIIQESMQKELSYASFFQEHGFEEASKLVKTYQHQFEEYVKKRWAIQYIQRVYLKNYYDPSRPFCKKRLERDLLQLNQETKMCLSTCKEPY